jgi:hypothetical protein
LKSENNNPWFNILLHTQLIVCATVDRYLGYITLASSLTDQKALGWVQRIKFQLHKNGLIRYCQKMHVYSLGSISIQSFSLSKNTLTKFWQSFDIFCWYLLTMMEMQSNAFRVIRFLHEQKVVKGLGTT